MFCRDNVLRVGEYRPLKIALSTRMLYLSIVSDYLENRVKLISSLGRQLEISDLDHVQLFSGSQQLARQIYLLDLLRSTARVDGDIAELGVWRGSNSLYMAKLSRILDLDRRLQAFDSFQGLPQAGTQDNSSYVKGIYAGDKQLFLEAIALHELESKLLIHEGLIEDSVPNWCVRFPNVRLSLIYFDADLYSPALTMFKHLAPRLSIGGVILLDEYGFAEWPGETLAADKFISDNANFSLEMTPNWVTQPSAIITRQT